MARYEDLSKQEQDAAAAWQQSHRDHVEYFVGETTHIGTIDDTPYYIVALTNSEGVLFALGIETAYQVWQRALIAWYLNVDTDPVMISPVTDPTVPAIYGPMNWSIPLGKH